MKRKGFTLVELLIVIVVIGILSAMMMLSSTEAVTSARASNIVSNLRNFKTAAMAMYVDHMDDMDAGKLPATTASAAHDILVKYMNKGGGDSGNAVDSDANYHLKLMEIPDETGSYGWYVYVRDVKDARVQEKLAGRASSVGLLDKEGAKYTTSTSDKTEISMFVTKVDASRTPDSNALKDTYSAS